MARLTNTKTGVVVHVADEKVDRFGAEWARESAAKSESKPAPKAAPKRASKSDDE